MMRLFLLMLATLLFLSACGGEDGADKKTDTPTPRPTITVAISPTPETLPESTPTPRQTTDLPGIELLKASADMCTVEEAYGELLGFDVIYHETTTANFVVAVLTGPNGEDLGMIGSPGENRGNEDGGGWGMYPPEVYDFPSNTLLTLDLTVYEGGDETTTLASNSTLTFNCTTGEAIQKSFTQN